MENNMNATNTNDKVEQKLNNLGEGQKEEILYRFERFKSYLGDKVSMGEKMGLKKNSWQKQPKK
ncbi:hypothetical protein MEZE111188_04885 [Mesobacillus zeae]